MKGLRRVVDSVGLLALVLLVAAWPVGYFRGDLLLWHRPTGRSFCLASGQGQVFLAVSTRAIFSEQRPAWVHLSTDAVGFRTGLEWFTNYAAIDRGRLGFRMLRGAMAPSLSIWGVPHWLISSAAGLVLLFRVQAVRRSRHRRRQGLCAVCGYDVRHSPDRCPECGTPTR